MIAPPLLARLIGQDVLHKWYYLPMIYAVTVPQPCWLCSLFPKRVT